MTSSPRPSPRLEAVSKSRGFRPDRALEARRGAPLDLSDALALVWFTLVALLVAGPLLGRGSLLLLDFPGGPHLARPDPLPLPSSGEIGNEVPLVVLQALLAEISAPLAQKLFLLAPIVVGGLGLYRVARRRLELAALPAALGGTLYVVNPFLHDRLLAGHLHFAIGYALLPWALGPLVDAIRAPTARRAVAVGLWFFVLAAASIHIAGIYALLALVCFLFADGPVSARASFALVTLVTAALLSSYWLLTAMLAPPSRHVGIADLAAYETRPGRLTVLPTLLSLYGFWRREFPRAADEHPALYLLVVPILGLVILGIAALARRGERRFTVALAAAGALALVLAAGTALPVTGDAFRWLFEHVGVLKTYREPQKFLALTSLAYAVFAAGGLARLMPGRPWRSAAATALAFAAVLGFGYSMFWGLGGEVKLERYPRSWAAADARMADRGPGRLLFLPWQLYSVWSFTDGRIVANPAPSYFSGREVLSGDDIGSESIPTQSADPFSYYLESVLARRAELQWFGHLVAPLGVRFVAWSVEADPGDYQMLSSQRDLRLLYESEDLALFENLAWRGDRLGLLPPASAEPGTSGTSPDFDASTRLAERSPPVAKAETGFPKLASKLPIWERVSPRHEPFVAVGERCTDGWLLGGESTRCHLGAVAAFATPRAEAVLWRPLAAVRLLGYLVSACALVAALVALRRGSFAS